MVITNIQEHVTVFQQHSIYRFLISQYEAAVSITHSKKMWGVK